MRSLLRKFAGLLSGSRNGRDGEATYRFAVADWTGIHDINLAAQVITAEGFEKWLAPQPLPLDEMPSILVLAPHQDDEAIGAGGTLLLAADAGAKISVLFVTDGGAKEESLIAGLYDRLEDYETRRWEEAGKVCRRLGADLLKLGVSNARPEPDLETIDRFGALISEIRPDVILTPWLLDIRAKHRMVNHMLWLANRRSALPPCEVWGYQVNNTLFPNGYVDITDVAERKRELIQIYESQNTLTRRFDHETLGLNAWNSHFLPNKEAVGREHYVEVFFALPLARQLELVEKFYFQNFESTYRGINRVCRSMTALHQTIAGR